MPEVEHLPGSTLGGYISPVRYNRYVTAYNETDTPIEAGTVVSLYFSPGGLSATVPADLSKDVHGVTAETIQPKRYGSVVLSGFTRVRAATADTGTGSQVATASGTAQSSATPDPKRYIGEALSYDPDTNTKLVYVRIA